MFRAPSPAIPAGRSRALRALLAGGLTLLGSVATTACGVPPELENAAPTTRPTPTPTVTVAPTPTPTPQPTPTPSASGLTPCAGNPSQTQVTALLRRSANLPRNARVTYRSGPLCAAGWQYSVVEVAGRDPLQVVTNGPANALRLVAAGSDVCSIRVRTEAPTEVRSAACEAPPPITGGL